MGKRTIAYVIHSGVNFFMEAPVFASAIILLPSFIVIMLCVCLCTISDSDDPSYTDDEGDEYDDEGEDEDDIPPEYYDEPTPESQETLDATPPGPEEEIENREVGGLRQRVVKTAKNDQEEESDDDS